jgi:hypothetical protein
MSRLTAVNFGCIHCSTVYTKSRVQSDPGGIEKRCLAQLRIAEGDLQRLMAELAALKRYDVISILAETAGHIAAAIGRLASLEHISTGLESSERLTTRGNSSRTGIAVQRATQGPYPRFRREGDLLIKVGWSGAKAAEYEHRAPYESVAATIRLIEEHTRKRGAFTVEEIEVSAKNTIPNYQLYLALGWMKSNNLLLQNGRTGYSVPSNVRLSEAASEIWRILGTSPNSKAHTRERHK